MLVIYLLLAFSLCFYTCGSSSSTSFGLVTKDAVILSASCEFSPGGGIIMQHNYDWIHKLGSNALVALHGDSSDCNYNLGVLQAAAVEYELNGDCDLNTLSSPSSPLSPPLLLSSMPCASLASLCRKTIADTLRSRPLNVDALFAGWVSDKDSNINRNTYTNTITGTDISLPSGEGKDEREEAGEGGVDGKPVLFAVDRLASMQPVTFAAHGAGLPSILSVLDSKYGVNTGMGYGQGQRQGQGQGERERGDREVKLSAGLDQVGGVGVVRDCWGAIRRRSASAGSLGKARVMAVGRSGCMDLGYC